MRKLYKLNFLLFFLLFACYGSRLSDKLINEIEIEDDNLCMAEGVEYKYADTRLIYWKCRLRIINQRLDSQFDDYSYSMFHKREFKRLRKIIKKRIKEQQNIIISNIRNSQEEKEHNYCIMMKNNYDGKKADKNDRYDYFECREKIEAIRKKNKEFAGVDNEEYFKRFLEEEEIEYRSNNSVDINGECINFAFDKDKLAECENNLKKNNKCSTDMNSKLNQRMIDDKIYCTRVSLNKYPDSLAKFDTGNGIENLGPKINKIDIVELRDKEYQKCYNERKEKWLKYRDYLEYECSDAFKIKNSNE